MARALCTAGPYRVLAGRLVLPWALQGLRPAGRILEIGAGGGAMAAQLLRRGQGAAGGSGLRLVATDYDQAMAVAAAAALAPFGTGAAAARADAAALPFADGSFDWVLSFAMLHHVVAWERALAEAVRVLRPGGQLAGYDLVDGPAMRLLHHAEHSEVRMMRADQLPAELRRLPVTDVRTRRAAGGLAMRFRLRKLP